MNICTLHILEFNDLRKGRYAHDQLIASGLQIYPSLPCFMILELEPMKISPLPAGSILSFVSGGCQRRDSAREKTSLDLVASSHLAPRMQLLEVCVQEVQWHSPPASLAGTPVEGFLNSIPLQVSLLTSPCQLAVISFVLELFSELLCHPVGPATLSAMNSTSVLERMSPSHPSGLPSLSTVSQHWEIL